METGQHCLVGIDKGHGNMLLRTLHLACQLSWSEFVKMRGGSKCPRIQLSASDPRLKRDFTAGERTQYHIADKNPTCR